MAPAAIKTLTATGQVGKKTVGVSGAAVLFGAAGLYLVYAGVRDVPFLEGLRSLIKGERPTGADHQPYGGPVVSPGAGIVDIGDPSDAAPSPGNTGIGSLGLVGNAANGLPALKNLVPTLTFYGKAERPDNPSSDHPHGKAIDIMNPSASQAERIIALFKSQPGAHYWIWNRRIGNITRLWASRPYTGKSPHTDHVHLSYF